MRRAAAPVAEDEDRRRQLVALRDASIDHAPLDRGRGPAGGGGGPRQRELRRTARRGEAETARGPAERPEVRPAQRVRQRRPGRRVATGRSGSGGSGSGGSGGVGGIAGQTCGSLRSVDARYDTPLAAASRGPPSFPRAAVELRSADVEAKLQRFTGERFHAPIAMRSMTETNELSPRLQAWRDRGTNLHNRRRPPAVLPR